MVALFRDQAVALLARERLHQMRDELRAKKAAVPAARFTAIEARMLWLCEKACDVTNAQPSIPTAKFPGVFRSRLAEQASKFFTMGSLATTIPGFGTVFANQQDWVMRVLRKGTRDERRERVDASTSKFALEVWRRAKRLIDASALTPNQKLAALANARSFYLGHLCHIASGVVTSPMIDDLTWHLPGTGENKLARDNVEGQVEDLIKTRLLQPSINTVEYFDWLPTAAEVPQQLFQAFSEVTRETYLGTDGYKGFKDLEDVFPANAPTVTPTWIADSLTALRTALGAAMPPVPGATPAGPPEWGFWMWVAILTPLVIPSLITLPMLGLLGQGRNLGDEALRNEKSAWQTFALHYGSTGLVVPFYVIIASATSPRGFTQESWVALVLSMVVLGFSIAMLARLDQVDNDSPAARWTILAIPAVLELLSFIYFLIVRPGGSRYNRLFMMLFTWHVLITCINVAYLAIPQIGKDMRDGGGAAAGWWFLYFLVIAPLFALVIPAAILRATNPTPPTPPTPVPPPPLPPAPPIVPLIQQPHYLRLFDDSTLVADPGVNAPTLAQHFFPAGDADATNPRRRRKLFTITFTGGSAGIDMYVRSRGDRLEIMFANAQPPTAALASPPPNNATVVALPQAPHRAKVFAAMLELVRELPGPGPGAVHAALEIPDNEDHLLPEGLVLALEFEDDLTRAQAARRTQADTWAKVPAAGLPIFHATKARLAVTFGTRGDATLPDEPDGVGPPVVATNLTGNVRQGANNTLVSGDANTRFVAEIQAGDLLQVGANQAVVDEVIDRANLRLSAPAAWLPGPAAPHVAAQRIHDDRRRDKNGTGNLRTHQRAITPPAVAGIPNYVVGGPPTVVGIGTSFDRFFMTGDVIRANVAGRNEERIVTAVRSATVMELDAPFSTAIDAAAPGATFVRVGRHGNEGMRFFASPATDLQSGASAIDHAADLAALLCLGGVSHAMADADRQPTSGATVRFPGAPIARVYQCFRNWNLDRRRVNEWKMLVAGGAYSEKGGRPITQPESTMIVPPVDDGWNPVNSAGEAVANQLGWVGVLRRWMDVARRADSDVLSDLSLRPGDPSNVLLSRGLAYLLDLPNPRP